MKGTFVAKYRILKLMHLKNEFHDPIWSLPSRFGQGHMYYEVREGARRWWVRKGLPATVDSKELKGNDLPGGLVIQS